MKVLMIDQFQHIIIKETEILPRIGDSLGCFNYKPFPIVQTVVLFAEPEFLLKSHDFDQDSLDIVKSADALVYAK